MIKSEFEFVEFGDLDDIAKLQPDGWSAFDSIFRFYINSPFCYPIKTISNGRIQGIGVSVRFGKTNWLAHIIVHETLRNRGIGLKIVNRLLQEVNPDDDESVLLIATSLGEPVYKKAGFRIVTEYVFFKKEIPGEYSVPDPHVIPYENKYKFQIWEMDLTVSGENRKSLLEPHLNKAMLFVKDDQVLGYYFPGLGEGLIIGDSPEAGLALMALKYHKTDKAVLPVDNTIGIKFLTKRGFNEISRAPRMILGPDLSWQPDKIYSRIGGNFG